MFSLAIIRTRFQVAAGGVRREVECVLGVLAVIAGVSVVLERQFERRE